MTNPQLTRNLLEVIRSLPDADRRWLLEQLGQDSADLSDHELAEEDLRPACVQTLPQIVGVDT